MTKKERYIFISEYYERKELKAFRERLAKQRKRREKIALKLKKEALERNLKDVY